MKIGELAKLTSVTIDSIRHYQRRGLICAERSDGNYRIFSQDSVERVLLIKRAIRLGFSIDELAEILGKRDSGDAPCREVRSLAAKKLEQIEDSIRQLEILRRQFTALLRDWDARLASTPEGERAYLLDSLPQGDPS